MCMDSKHETVPMAWDAVAWLKEWIPIWNSRDKWQQHGFRAKYYKDHVRFVMDRCYVSVSGKRVEIPWTEEELAAKTKMYREELHPGTVTERRDTVFEFLVTDCLIAAKTVQEETPGKTAVLNLANRHTPGGGVFTGSGAQEESCFLRSNYLASLYPHAEFAEQYGFGKAAEQYPMDRNFGGVWSEGITVFRGRETAGYPLLDEPWKTNFIAVAALNHPELVFDEQGRERLSADMEQAALNKIRTIFNIAAENGVDNLILGAFGCGAFHSPSEHIAELFCRVLEEPPYNGRFGRIVFSIFDPALAETFKNVFMERVPEKVCSH